MLSIVQLAAEIGEFDLEFVEFDGRRGYSRHFEAIGSGQGAHARRGEIPFGFDRYVAVVTCPFCPHREGRLNLRGGVLCCLLCLRMKRTVDELAEQYFIGLIKEAVHSLAPKIMEMAHKIAVSMR